MTPITAELNKERYCLVKVPQGITDIDLPLQDFGHALSYKVPGKGWCTEMLPYVSGSWSIIGLGKDLSEEQWKEIVERSLVMSIKYKDYECVKSSFHTATQSGLSWLKSLNADENYLILKQQP